MTQREPWTSTIIIGVIVALLVLASNLQYADEQKEQDFYCKMVDEGSWPDYNKTYQKQCPTEGVK